MQLEFFPMSKEEELEREFEKLQESCDKVRKKLFAQNRELAKMYTELHHDFEALKKSICYEKEI